VNLHGIFPPTVTPFTVGAQDLDLEAVGVNVDRWMRTKLRGLVLLGTNSESAFVEEDEADRLVAAVRERMPADRDLIVGTARESTRGTIDACRRAGRSGATAVLVRPSAFFKNAMTPEALVRHYSAIADASPVPVLLYNFPGAFGVNLSSAVVVKLAEHANIVGMKESSGDLGQIADEVALTPARFEVVVGSAPTLYASLAVGAVGGILALANVAPGPCIALYEAATTGRHEEALRLQRALTPLARLVTTTHGVPGLKAAMALAGYRGGVPRMPLVEPKAAAVEEIARALEALRAEVGDLDGRTA